MDSPSGTSRYDAYDRWLFVGTLGPAKPSFIVTGLFYPKAERQARLFE